MKLNNINKITLIKPKYVEKKSSSSSNPIHSLKLSFCSNSCDKFEYKNPKNKELRSIQTLAIQAGIEDLDLESLKSFTQENINQIIELLKRKDIQEYIQDEKLDSNNIYDLSTLDKESYTQLKKLLKRKDIQELIKNDYIDGLSLYNFARLDKKEFKQLLELLKNASIKRLLLEKK